MFSRSVLCYFASRGEGRLDKLEEQMHPTRKLFAVTSAILAFTVVGPSASQAADPVFSAFTVDKECGASTGFTGMVVSSCTITRSSFQALRKAKVNYYGPELGGNGQFVSSTVFIDATTGPKNSTALGHCIVYRTAMPLAGMCTFNGGSGTLAGFQAVVKVTFTGPGTGVNKFHWEGVQSHTDDDD
jgi:hypothetical protein